MADNTQLNPGTGGDVIATEDIGGVKYPVTKIVVGEYGASEGPATVANPLPTNAVMTQMSEFYPYGQAPTGNGVPMLDGWGSLQVRAGIVTDAGSCTDDFDAMSTPLTGTLTFANGSTAVTGTLSTFGDGTLARTRYVKLDAHSETAWALVSTIEDDGHLTLATPYAGANGTGAASWATWVTSTPAGASISAANSICSIVAPTTGSTQTHIWHDADYGPITTQNRIAISQRIADQTIVSGFLERPDGGASACFVFTGTDATKVYCSTTSSDATGSGLLREVSLPANGVTSDAHTYGIAVVSNNVSFYIDSVLVDSRDYAIPPPNTVLGLLCGIRNGGTGPATPTTVDVHWMHYDDVERVDVIVSQPDASKLQVTAQGADADGSDPTGHPILTACLDPDGHVHTSMVDASGNHLVGIGDSVTGDLARVRPASEVTSADAGLVVHSPSLAEGTADVRRQLESTHVALLDLVSAFQEGLLRIQIRNNDLVGGAPTQAPSLVGGVDTQGKLRSRLLDTSGRGIVVGPAAIGAVIALGATPVYNGLSDGTNIRAVLGDTSGRAMCVGAAATASTVANAGNPIVVAGTDGTNSRSLRTDTVGKQYLVCDAIPGANVPTLAVAVIGGRDNLGKTRIPYVDEKGVAQVANPIAQSQLEDLGAKLDKIIRIMQIAFNVEG